MVIKELKMAQDNLALDLGHSKLCIMAAAHQLISFAEGSVEGTASFQNFHAQIPVSKSAVSCPRGIILLPC